MLRRPCAASIESLRTVPLAALSILLFSAVACSSGGAGDGNGGGGGAGGHDLAMSMGDRDGGASDMHGSSSDMRGGIPDLGPPPICSTAKAPMNMTTFSTTDNIPDPDDPYVFSVGSSVYSVLSFGTKWNQWTGTGWSETPIPWPAELTSNPGGTSRTLRFRTCNFRGVKELADGRALFMAVDGSDYWLVTFDGISIRDPIKLTGGAIPCTRTHDGHYYQLTGNRLLGGDPGGTWDSGTPVPIPTLSWSEVDLAATRDDRIVITYVATPMGGSSRHVFVLSKPAGGAWGTPVDITPKWAVDASSPLAVPARDGGLVVAASGASGSYTVPAIWRSADSVTFGTEDTVLSGFVDAAVLAVRATCLDSTMVLLNNRVGMVNAFELYVRSGASWTQLDRATGNYLEGAGITLLPDGRAFWGYAVPNGVTLRATM